MDQEHLVYFLGQLCRGYLLDFRKLVDLTELLFLLAFDGKTEKMIGELLALALPIAPQMHKCHFVLYSLTKIISKNTKNKCLYL